MKDENPIIIALDYPNAKQANEFIQRIQGSSCKLKVGLELFIAEGPAFVEQLVAQGHQVFLDLKLHDIPNTVASACRSASSLGVWMMTLHALGGEAMLGAAREEISNSTNAPKLVAVSVLTSMDDNQLKGVGIENSPKNTVMKLAEVAMAANMDGMVCSVHEVAAMREKWGELPTIVTPGIRLQYDQSHDQSRIASPKQAHDLGSNYIVVGRPITQAANPVEAMNQYLDNWSSSAE